MKTLTCVRCHKTFPGREHGKGSQKDRCPPCHYIAVRERGRYHGRMAYVKFPRRMKSQKLKQRYGITIDQWEAMLKAQGDACAVCRRPFGTHKRCTDHDHVTKRVRGIVCSSCNTRLMWFETKRAHILTYLEGH